MLFKSTRGFSDSSLSFLNVVQMGLAPDGGLFVPESFPSVELEEIDLMQHLSYEERVFSLLQKFDLGIADEDLQEMIEKAYASFSHEKRCPVSKTEEKRFLLELFHGPTASFKDMALQLTPHFFKASQTDDQQKFCIVTATSGDTGIAAVEGFRKHKNISVIILYPKDGVSPVQKLQMQAVDAPNVKILGVDGDFDFCQSSVKELFADTEFAEEIQEQYTTQFSAANSMNWGRLLPQVAYYFSAYADLLSKEEIELGEEIEVCVPSGNFGNILGAYIAKKMGLPISKFICASNENNVLTEFINTGVYDISDKHLLKTDSPSIDILKSSNTERFLYRICGDDSDLIQKFFTDLNTVGKFSIEENLLNTIQKEFAAAFCTEQEMQETVRKYYEEKKLLLDPHTAVAMKVSEMIPSDKKRIVVATAHYGKFPVAIAKILGKNENTSLPQLFEMLVEMNPIHPQHSQLQKTIASTAIQTQSIPNDYQILKDTIEQFLKTQ